MDRKYNGTITVNDRGQFVTFEDRGRTRTLKFRAKPRLEENIIERHRTHLASPRRVKFYGHVELDPEGERDNEAIMFISFLRFQDPPPAELLAELNRGDSAGYAEEDF